MAEYTTAYSNDTGNAPGGVSINDTRRKLDFGERIAELAPQQSPFFVYLNKVAKKPTADPVFKFLEQRHQWQRRNFKVSTAVDGATYTKGAVVPADLVLDCAYDKFGKTTTLDEPCSFLLPGQIISIMGTDGNVATIKLASDATITHTAVDGTTAGYTTITAAGAKVLSATNTDTDFAADAKGQVIGSAWAEGSKAPDGWEDAMYDREGYCQIFKTAIKTFSNTSIATEYRGVKNEFNRNWTEKLMEHKMDMEQNFLFGIGSSDETIAGAPLRYTHGVVPYTEKNGKIYNFTYASSGYDDFLEAMEDFFSHESANSGNKLVLASRKVISFLNKLGSSGFMNNTVGSSQYNLDVTNIPGKFGHNVTKVDTIFGNLHFIAEPLFRGMYEDYCVALDMKNLAYRPLSGNGVNRDTFIKTNVQDNDVDGRKDMITTEAGLEISLPETHAILKFS
tara:strand:+ start:624 stop:1973 length:1350 start_codon:yes stop_codon:yes gene_type:complete